MFDIDCQDPNEATEAIIEYANAKARTEIPAKREMYDSWIESQARILVAAVVHGE